MKRQTTIDLCFSALVSWIASSIYAIRDPVSYQYLTTVAASQDPQPFVFRMLLPLLARALEKIAGIPAVYNLVLLAILSSIGLFFSLKYLCVFFLEDEKIVSVLSLVTSAATMGVIALKFPKTYDVSTALLFTLALGLLARQKFLAYFLLFPVVTLNRETSFLLTLVFLVVCLPPSRLWLYGAGYQTVIYCLIRLGENLFFADHPGGFLEWRPVENILGHLKYLPVILAGAAILIPAICHGWHKKPWFLRTAFLTLFPLQVVLYITCGYPMELRVFAESLPILGLLALWDLPVILSRASHARWGRSVTAETAGRSVQTHHKSNIEF